MTWNHVLALGDISPCCAGLLTHLPTNQMHTYVRIHIYILCVDHTADSDCIYGKVTIVLEYLFITLLGDKFASIGVLANSIRR